MAIRPFPRLSLASSIPPAAFSGDSPPASTHSQIYAWPASSGHRRPSLGVETPKLTAAGLRSLSKVKLGLPVFPPNPIPGSSDSQNHVSSPSAAFEIRRVAPVRQNVWCPEQEGVECGWRRPDQRPAGRCSPPCVVLPAGA